MDICLMDMLGGQTKRFSCILVRAFPHACRDTVKPAETTKFFGMEGRAT